MTVEALGMAGFSSTTDSSKYNLAETLILSELIIMAFVFFL